jgi:uncharacterized protein
MSGTTLAKWSAALRSAVLPPRTPARRRFHLWGRTSGLVSGLTCAAFAVQVGLSAGALGCQKAPAEPLPATTGAPTAFVVPPRTATPDVSAAPPPPPAPASPCPADPDKAPELATAQLSIDSGPVLTVELARTPKEAERGLMYRTSMAEDHGMLFYLGTREDHAFWMHNTCIPLDILFIDELGTIVGIKEDVPILNDQPRSVGRMSTHVLEVNGGWCRRHGVRAGQKLLFPKVSK